jgi:hypothetical protein
MSRNGWGTALSLVTVSLLGSYLLLWSPPRSELGSARQDLQSVEDRLAAGNDLEIEADRITEQIGSRAIKTTDADVRALAQKAGIPDSSISGSRIEILGSPSQVGRWASDLSGQTYLDPSGQLRGEETLIRAQIEIESRGPRSLLRVEFSLP